MQASSEVCFLKLILGLCSFFMCFYEFEPQKGDHCSFFIIIGKPVFLFKSEVLLGIASIWYFIINVVEDYIFIILFQPFDSYEVWFFQLQNFLFRSVNLFKFYTWLFILIRYRNQKDLRYLIWIIFNIRFDSVLISLPYFYITQACIHGFILLFTFLVLQLADGIDQCRYQSPGTMVLRY